MAAVPSIIAFLLAATLSPLRTSPDTLLTEARTVGDFQHAVRLAVAPQGAIYVVDAGRNQVLRFTEADAPTATIGGYGWDASAFDRPTGLATDGLNLFVSDEGNHRIQRFDRFLNFVSSFSTRDTSVASARIGYPLGVALSRSGELYVLDGENLRVVKFAPNLRFERAFGDFDDERARLSHPLKILIGPDDHVYLLEPGRLLEFDMFGHYLRSIGAGTLADAKSFALTGKGFVVLSDDRLSWFAADGTFIGSTLAKHLITEEPLGPLEDAVEVGGNLLLLTSRRLHIFHVNVR